MKHSKGLMRTLLLAVLLTAMPVLAQLPPAIAGMPEEGEGRYVMVLWERGTPDAQGTPIVDLPVPDLQGMGGRLLLESGSRQVIDLPLEEAETLRAHPSVKYLQRVYMGEPPEEVNEPRLTARAKPRGIATETDPLTWESGEYEYDGSGNITKIGTHAYRYDTAGRLIQANAASKTETYEYDAFGNLLQMAVTGAQPVDIAVDSSSNRLMGVPYDPAGNVSSSAKTSYEYDGLNRLVSTTMKLGTGSKTRYRIYDVNDELIGVLTGDDQSQWMIRDLEGRVLREFTGDTHNMVPWLWQQDFIYGGEGQAVAGETQEIFALGNPSIIYGGMRHYHLDHLQTVRMVSNGTGQRAAEHEYYPFGIEATRANQEYAFLEDSQIDELRFAGHQRDYMGLVNVEHREYLDYMHARYYDPNLGRFLSVDPIIDFKTNLRNPQGWNRYSYVRNNPIRWTDPTGKVIAYDDDFRKRLKTDADFRAAFDAWKKTAAGKAQWSTMGKDTNTLYTFKVGTVKAMTGVLKEEQANGMTLPLVSARNENKAGKLDMSNVSMTINADFIKSTHSLVPEMTSRTMAKALFEEAQHGLDIGSGTMSAKQAWDAETRFHTDTEPRMKMFENQLNAILPPPNFD